MEVYGKCISELKKQWAWDPDFTPNSINDVLRNGQVMSKVQ